MIVKMGEFIGLPLKQRSSEILVLQERLRAMSGVMFLFDEVAIDEPGSFQKLEYLRCSACAVDSRCRSLHSL